jgi:Tfp pilus assembly protein PilN
MIRVNLVGAGRKKAKAGAKLAMPTSFVPFFLIAIALGFVGAGYWWYAGLTKQVTDLDAKIAQLTAQKAALENIIKQDQIYEGRKKALENRVKIIEGLQRNQVSPIVELDQLSEAVDRTKYVWLTNLDQNNTILTMSGTGTSLDAVADFYTNLTATGYFRNIDISNATDSNGNFTFSLRCEFSPPRPPATGEKAAAGGN